LVRVTELRIRASIDPAGGWSRPIDVPVDCDGRYRAIVGRDPDNDPSTPPPGAFNCYQMQAHPDLTSANATSLVFGYYDRFDADSTNATTPADGDPESEAIRLVRVPLCVERTNVTTGESVAADHVVGKCWMTNGNWGETMTRREVAATLWRLSGFVPRPLDTSLTQVAGDYREAVSFLVDPDLTYHQVWPSSTTSAFTEDVTRAELIRLLWMFSGSPPASGTPIASDWGSIQSTAIADAVRWANQAGITCSGTFNPGQPAKRRTAASWIYHLQQATPCTGTESE